MFAQVEGSWFYWDGPGQRHWRLYRLVYEPTARLLRVYVRPAGYLLLSGADAAEVLRQAILLFVPYEILAAPAAA